MCVCVCVCVCVLIYRLKHTIFIHRHIYTHMNAHVDSSPHIHMPTDICIYIYIYITVNFLNVLSTCFHIYLSINVNNKWDVNKVLTKESLRRFCQRESLRAFEAKPGESSCNMKKGNEIENPIIKSCILKNMEKFKVIQELLFVLFFLTVNGYIFAFSKISATLDFF